MDVTGPQPSPDIWRPKAGPPHRPFQLLQVPADNEQLTITLNALIRRFRPDDLEQGPDGRFTTFSGMGGDGW